MQPEAIPVPLQNLQPVTVSVAEHIKLTRKQVKAKTPLYDGSQAVDGFAHVGRSAGEVAGLAVDLDHSAFRAWQTRASNAVSVSA